MHILLSTNLITNSKAGQKELYMQSRRIETKIFRRSRRVGILSKKKIQGKVKLSSIYKFAYIHTFICRRIRHTHTHTHNSVSHAPCLSFLFFLCFLLLNISPNRSWPKSESGKIQHISINSLSKRINKLNRGLTKTPYTNTSINMQIKPFFVSAGRKKKVSNLFTFDLTFTPLSG